MQERISSIIKSRTLTVVVLLHIFLIGFCAMRNGFAWTEVGLLPTGIADWQYGDFNSFRVNPPLVRDFATFPVAMLIDPEISYLGDSSNPRDRMEWDLARAMIKDYGQSSYRWLSMARLMCLTFALIGILVAVRWAGRIYGSAAAFGVLLIWATSPSLIGYGSLISGDAQAACMSLLLLYVFRNWLEKPSWIDSAILGFVAGLTILTKSSMLVLVALLPVLWLVISTIERLLASRSITKADQNRKQLSIARGTAHWLMIAVVVLLLVNLAYGFEGSFQRLGEYEFISKALAGAEQWEPFDWSGNRFRGTLVGSLPVPLPADFVVGLDLQKWDFDRERWSYLFGQWHNSGWWWYYLFGTVVKTRIAVMLLAIIAIGSFFLSPRLKGIWKDELILASAGALLLFLVSSQTGLNRHLRYLLPAIPCAIIWSGRAFMFYQTRSRLMKGLVSICVAWMVTSSLWIYPHSISYFNESLGGPMNADRVFNASNLDWGQDLRYLERWQNEDRKARKPLWVKSYLHPINPRHVGINCQSSKLPSMSYRHYVSKGDNSFPPGWYAVDRETRLRRSGDYLYLNELEPAAYAGYGFVIYHITEEISQRLLEKVKQIEPLPPKDEP